MIHQFRIVSLIRSNKTPLFVEELETSNGFPNNEYDVQEVSKRHRHAVYQKWTLGRGFILQRP